VRAGSLNPHAAHARSEHTGGGGGGGGAYARHGEEREEVYALHKAAASTGYTGPSRATDTNLMRQEQWHKCVPVAPLRARARASVSSSASGGEQRSVATSPTQVARMGSPALPTSQAPILLLPPFTKQTHARAIRGCMRGLQSARASGYERRAVPHPTADRVQQLPGEHSEGGAARRSSAQPGVPHHQQTLQGESTHAWCALTRAHVWPPTTQPAPVEVEGREPQRSPTHLPTALRTALARGTRGPDARAAATLASSVKGSSLTGAGGVCGVQTPMREARAAWSAASRADVAER
jgi:hypothetical protein